MNPTERFIIAHRWFTFLDEWGLYVVLIWLLYTENHWFIPPVALFGGVAIAVSYKKQWEYEKAWLSCAKETANAHDIEIMKCCNCKKMLEKTSLPHPGL